MKNLMIALVMGFSSINANFAYASLNNVDENNSKEIMNHNTSLDSTTGTVASTTTSNTSFGVLKSELIQPNAFLDYGIDLYNQTERINYTTRTHAHGAIQPNAFVDYGIDLNYKGSTSTIGINVGELSNQTIKNEQKLNPIQNQDKVIGFESFSPVMLYLPYQSGILDVIKTQIDEIIEYSGFNSTTTNNSSSTEESPDFLKMFFNFI